MARDSLYSNSSRSSRMGGGWIYQNGELYHYGVPGMKWYQTIFGGYDNPRSMTYDPKRGLRENLRTIGSNALSNIKGYGKHVKSNINKYYYSPFKNERRKDLSKVYGNVHDKSIKANNITYIDRYLNKQLRDGSATLEKLQDDPSVINIANQALQTAQFGGVYAANQLLKKLGLDDEVEKIMVSILGPYEASEEEKQRASELSAMRFNPDPNATQARLEEAERQYKLEKANAVNHLRWNPDPNATQARLEEAKVKRQQELASRQNAQRNSEIMSNPNARDLAGKAAVNAVSNKLGLNFGSNTQSKDNGASSSQKNIKPVSLNELDTKARDRVLNDLWSDLASAGNMFGDALFSDDGLKNWMDKNAKKVGVSPEELEKAMIDRYYRATVKGFSAPGNVGVDEFHGSRYLPRDPMDVIENGKYKKKPYDFTR